MVPSSVHERLQLLAFIGVRSSQPCSKLMPHIDPIDAIEEAHSVAGAYGLMLKVRVESTAALLLLVEQLRMIPGVEGTETSIVLKTHIDRPIALPEIPGPSRVRSR